MKKIVLLLAVFLALSSVGYAIEFVKIIDLTKDKTCFVTPRGDVICESTFDATTGPPRQVLNVGDQNNDCSDLFIEFDSSAIDDTTVKSASLFLTGHVARNGGSPRVLNVNPITATWDENDQNIPAVSGATILDAINIDPSDVGNTIEHDVTNAVSYIADPANTNNGLGFIVQGACLSATHAHAYYSREDTFEPPFIKVVYEFKNTTLFIVASIVSGSIENNGDTFDLKVNVSNIGAHKAVDVVVNAKGLDAGNNLVSLPNDWDVDQNKVNVGDLDPGETAMHTFTITRGVDDTMIAATAKGINTNEVVSNTINVPVYILTALALAGMMLLIGYRRAA